MALSYSDAARWYFSFARFDASLPRGSDAEKLARMRELLSRLGNPEARFPAIHIAGTKGKGSTAALIESSLRRAGYRTGLFTSPHLHSFRERVRIDGRMISQEKVVAHTMRLQVLASEFPTATFFEWVTALAFETFAAEQVDVAVVEVGLGGRLDCTNVLTPRVSVITPISLDHMDVLGETLSEIAAEKAGIIKPNVPVVVAAQPDQAMTVIRETAEMRGAPLIDVAYEFQWELEEMNAASQKVRVNRAGATDATHYTLPLFGPHQRENLATALTVIEALRTQCWRIPDSALQQGVATVEWYGRFEMLTHAPSIVVDGAHNRASAHVLVRTLDEVFPSARVHFVFGASADKDLGGMLAELAPRATTIVMTLAQHARAAAAAHLAALAVEMGLDARVAPTVQEALREARAGIGQEDVVCVTGSLFIVAEARAILLQEQGRQVETDRG